MDPKLSNPKIIERLMECQDSFLSLPEIGRLLMVSKSCRETVISNLPRFIHAKIERNEWGSYQLHMFSKALFSRFLLSPAVSEIVEEETRSLWEHLCCRDFPATQHLTGDVLKNLQSDELHCQFQLLHRKLCTEKWQHTFVHYDESREWTAPESRPLALAPWFHGEHCSNGESKNESTLPTIDEINCMAKTSDDFIMLGHVYNQRSGECIAYGMMESEQMTYFLQNGKGRMDWDAAIVLDSSDVEFTMKVDLMHKSDFTIWTLHSHPFDESGQSPFLLPVKDEDDDSNLRGHKSYGLETEYCDGLRYYDKESFLGKHIPWLLGAIRDSTALFRNDYANFLRLHIEPIVEESRYLGIELKVSVNQVKQGLLTSGKFWIADDFTVATEPEDVNRSLAFNLTLRHCLSCLLPNVEPQSMEDLSRPDHPVVVFRLSEFVRTQQFTNSTVVNSSGSWELSDSD
jgi:hypothetical protein